MDLKGDLTVAPTDDLVEVGWRMQACVAELLHAVQQLYAMLYCCMSVTKPVLAQPSTAQQHLLMPQQAVQCRQIYVCLL